MRTAVTLLAVAVLVGGCTADSPPPPTPASGSPAGPATGASLGDGGLISFATEARGQVALVRPDGTGRVERVSQDGWPAALAPDGRTLAFTSRTAQGRMGIGLVAVDGSERRELPMPSGTAMVPAVWSPDSRLLAVTDISGDIQVVPADLAGARLLVRAPGLAYDFPLAWSADGRWIAFMRLPTNDVWPVIGQLYVVAADGSGRPWRVSPPGTSVRHYYIGPASFFPDSTRIGFVAVRGRDGAEDPNEMRGRLMVADLRTHQAETITDWSAWTLTTRVSPDGQWLVFDKSAGDDFDRGHQLHLVRPDGTGEREVHSSPFGSVSAIWSPDGTRLLTAVDGAGANNLVIVRADGTGPVVELTRTGGETYLFYDWVQQS